MPHLSPRRSITSVSSRVSDLTRCPLVPAELAPQNSDDHDGSELTGVLDLDKKMRDPIVPSVDIGMMLPDFLTASHASADHVHERSVIAE